ncbi:NTPase KAP [Clostridium perfringens]|nr:NTPase KAP [Clostridium perfringens]
MTIKCDNAIKSKHEDLLERKGFASNIADNIINYKEESAITIGLIGKWGSGKSSVINMIKEEIKEKKQAEKNIEFIDFNPWCFSGNNKIIEDFLGVLISHLGIDGNNKLNELGKKLKLYSFAMKPFTFVPKVNKVFSLLEKTFSSSSKFIDEYCKQNKGDINKLKEDINEILKDDNKKIVITIDDIDRLENDEIKEIFRLVRAVGDFNNIIYILAFDDEKVCKVFSSGPDYIDKIINIPIYMPIMQQSALNQYFWNKLNDNFKLQEINADYWKYVKDILEDNFKDLRELNRFMNVLIFNKNGIAEELNIVDYIVITFLKMFDKEIYNFIRENKIMFFTDNLSKNLKEKLKELNIKSERNIDIENLSFRMFNKNCNRHLRGINKKKYFDTYFEEILSNEVYSLKEISKFSKLHSIEDLNLYLEKLNHVELMKLFKNLNEVSGYLDIKQRYLFEEYLRYEILKLSKEKKISFSDNMEQEVAFNGLKYLLSGMEDYKLIFKSIDFKNIDYDVLSFMNYIESIKNILNVKFDEKTLNDITEYIYSKKYDEDMYDLFYILRNIGINVESYIKHIISSEEGLINYLKSTKETVDYGTYWRRYDEDGGPIDVEDYEVEKIILENITDFIEFECIKKAVDKLIKANKKEYSLIIADFHNCITREEQKERMSKWKEL